MCPARGGTLRGGVVSLILMNLFMHHPFDRWMHRTGPNCPFARCADDAVVHCHSRRQPEYVMRSIATRLAACGLTTHPEKSKIVFCRDSNRSERHPHASFSFSVLRSGRGRRAARKGDLLPASCREPARVP
ncbi:reverse transcriptase domain-containing protein [Cupriavidus basilensis]|uniref:reverse transcriptase domain-containing protein n=1 Tax=Cupriavidus basilensis TaxID=68895 RepID=UPI00191C4B22